MRGEILKAEFGDRLQLDWRAYLLRPKRNEQRHVEKFRQYTQSWLHVASDEPGGDFRPWATDESPPSHSIPPHVVAKAAKRLDTAAYDRIHDALLRAYFTDNRDISSEETLLDIWQDVGLDAADFESTRDPALVDEVLAEHEEAQRFGALGAPAFRMSHHEVVMVGLHPVPVLSRWIGRVLAGEV